MMLHHVSVGVRDVAKSAAFYDKVLKALGYKRVMEVLPYAVAYGDKTPEFWVGLPHDQKKASIGNGVHISFAARNKAAVNAFHAAALASGGKDDGAPGPRPDYGPDYYGAFCRDIDGNKIEAVVVKMPATTKAAAKPAKKAKRR
ncbi:MAG: VOC family protein [Alphaproteobacteria bacterium]|jgi:catechol 2,3-dioxygenase-like lactoylglutathione lyase family enzyme|nr:VOC family protein [Alphaproteobacteria bacterium]